MSNSNDFLAFAIAAGANVRTPSGWAGDATLAQGIQAGVLPSISLNTALRQGTSVAAMLAQFTADYGPGNVQDNGNIPTLEAQFKAALAMFFNANVIRYGVDTGTVNAMAAVCTPPLTALADGMIFEVNPLFTNTSGTVTFAANGQAPVNVVRWDMSPLSIGDITNKALMAYHAATNKFLLLNPARILTALVQPPLTTVYVATTGNDSNPGSSALPFATLQAAINMLSQYAAASVTINVAAGTYNMITVNAWSGVIGRSAIGNWVINCAAGTYFVANVAGGRGIGCFGANVQVYNASCSAYFECYNANSGGSLQLYNCAAVNYRSTTIAYSSYNAGQLWMYGNMSVSGTGGGLCFNIGSNAVGFMGYNDGVQLISCTFTFVGTCAFAIVCNVQSLGYFAFNYLATTLAYGTVTGVSYSCSYNSILNFGGHGTSYCPGSAGSTSTGGVVVP